MHYYLDMHNSFCILASNSIFYQLCIRVALNSSFIWYNVAANIVALRGKIWLPESRADIRIATRTQYSVHTYMYYMHRYMYTLRIHCYIVQIP